MKPNLVMALTAIASKPGATLGTHVITARRICRVLAGRLDEIRAERRALARQARTMPTDSEFAAARARKLEQRAEMHREQDLAATKRVLIAYGFSLLRDQEGLTTNLGLDRLCDLLNANPVQRRQAIEDGDTTLHGLIVVAGVEDSAQHQDAEWGHGGPLYRACHLALMDTIKRCPPHLLPDPRKLLSQKAHPQLRIVP